MKEIKLYPNRTKWVFALVLMLILTAGSVITGNVWSAIFFVTMTGISIVMLLPESTYIILNNDGLEYSSLFKKKSYKWSDLSEVGIRRYCIPYGGIKRELCFNYKDSFKDGWENHRKTIRSIGGYDIAINSSFEGVTVDKLAEMAKDYLHNANVSFAVDNKISSTYDGYATKPKSTTRNLALISLLSFGAFVVSYIFTHPYILRSYTTKQEISTAPHSTSDYPSVPTQTSLTSSPTPYPTTATLTYQKSQHRKVLSADANEASETLFELNSKIEDYNIRLAQIAYVSENGKVYSTSKDKSILSEIRELLSKREIITQKALLIESKYKGQLD